MFRMCSSLQSENSLAGLDGCRSLRLQKQHSCGRSASTHALLLVSRDKRKAAGLILCSSATAGATDQIEDKWVARTLSVLPPAASNGATPPGLQPLRSSCLAALRTLRMPSTRNEDYKFTDLTPLLQTTVQSAEPLSSEALAAVGKLAESRRVEGAVQLVVVNGQLRLELSEELVGLHQGVYVGGLQGAPPEVVEQLGVQAAARGGPFAVINGALVEDVVCVVVPPNGQLGPPLHVLYVHAGSPQGCTSSPSRLLLVLGRHASGTVYEEFASLEGSGAAFTTAVAEVVLEEHAQLSLGYLQLEAAGSFHTKSTLASQSRGSSFNLTEVALGARLGRHDVNVLQEGEETWTQMKSFLCCGQQDQLLDLHSKLRLTHPRGEANQLHKCIVSQSSGRGVFDGNVRVERLAQKSDARQLSRNLLLAPRASVSVKPNLQIIADDVKCSHGCTVSDLEEDQLFYFQSRGIDAKSARQALVFSFGAEVVQELGSLQLQKRVEAAVKHALARVQL